MAVKFEVRAVKEYTQCRKLNKLCFQIHNEKIEEKQ